MKNLLACFSLGFALLSFEGHSQSKECVKLWETPSNLRVPESTLWDKTSKTIYFSNIEGETNGKDNKGSIGKIDANGKKVMIDWLTGLNAPKGLALYNNKLYVADVDEIVVIDMKEAKVLERISIFDSKFLNDITITKEGVIYISDTEKGNIHEVNNGAISTFLTGQKSVNGLLAVGTDLYFLANGVLWKADKNKMLLKIAEGMDESTDGLERTKNGDFIVSCWNGIIYRVKEDGNKTVLLDTREQKLNTADIGLDADKNILYVPTFFGNSIYAYQLK